MAYPPRPHFGYVLHPFYAGGCVTHVIHQSRVHPVEQPGEHQLARLPHDHQDSSGYKEPYYGVSKRVPEPHSNSSHKDSKACPTVRPGVVAVGDERGAAYLPAHPDTEDRYRLVAHEPYDRRCTKRS